MEDNDRDGDAGDSMQDVNLPSNATCESVEDVEANIQQIASDSVAEESGEDMYLHQALEDFFSLYGQQTSFPDAIIAHYMSQAGLDPLNMVQLRLFSLAMQNFLTELVQDAKLHAVQGTGEWPQEAGGRVVRLQRVDNLTVEDAIHALRDRGIHVHHAAYYQ